MKFIALLALFALPVLANTPPEITNVRASQRAGTKLVDIYYDAADADGDALKVRIEISDNDGVKYSVPAFSLTGDIGEGVAVGKNKHIVWDAGTDWDGEYSDQMRVKVYAIDAQGFPGMEWGNEVPPGGFLLGQDGGAEGSGPSRHVNIPWSYWLGKYEVTCQQYCDFLNAALVSGFVQRYDTKEVRIASGTLPGINTDYRIISIGDDQRIRWNVNNFEVVGSFTNHPVLVTWYGAMAFCRYYGYDLPTEAEWEKAARGPDHDDQDEHLKYPWGNSIDGSCAWYGNGTTPVGYYDGNQIPVGNDMVNEYGLYDVIGNAAEWTRSAYDSSALPIESYEVTESLDSARNRAIDSYGCGVVKGRDNENMYNRYRNYYSPDGTTSSGFRVIRRDVSDVAKAKSVGIINFSDVGDTVVSFTKDFAHVTVDSGNGTGFDEVVGASTNRMLRVSNSTLKLGLSDLHGKLRYVRFKMTGYNNSSYVYVRLYSVFADGSTWYNGTTGNGSGVWTTRSLVARENAIGYYLEIYSSNNSNSTILLDDLEFFTTSE